MSANTTANELKNKKAETSMCDLIQSNTSEILQKTEFQVPVYLQGYSDLFTKYLHSFNTYFGTCRMSEKQIFDKIGINHTVMNEIAEYWNFVKNLTVTNIELQSKIFEDYIQFRISTVESFDKYTKSFSDYFAKAISELNKK